MFCLSKRHDWVLPPNFLAKDLAMLMWCQQVMWWNVDSDRRLTYRWSSRSTNQKQGVTRAFRMTQLTSFPWRILYFRVWVTFDPPSRLFIPESLPGLAGARLSVANFTYLPCNGSEEGCHNFLVTKHHFVAFTRFTKTTTKNKQRELKFFLLKVSLPPKIFHPHVLYKIQ